MFFLVLGLYQTNVANQITSEASIIIIFMGMFIFAFSVGKREKTSRNDINPYVLFNSWRELEALLIQLNLAKYHKGPRYMLEYLSSNRMISTDENQILELLQIRNEIVHTLEDELKISKEELQQKIIMAKRVINKLSKIILPEDSKKKIL